jgi:hypothetical protein
MRVAYLDEAGVGNVDAEPFTVVAGVIVSTALQWRTAQRWLHDIVKRNIRKDEQQGFVFHATDLFHGTKATHRNRYSKT